MSPKPNMEEERSSCNNGDSNDDSHCIVFTCPPLPPPQEGGGEGEGRVPQRRQRRKARRMAIAYYHCRAANPAPTSGKGVISPARIVANVLNDTFGGGKEVGAVMAVAELNGTTTTTMTLVWRLRWVRWSTTSRRGKDMMGNSDSSYH
jgi:hypothetical protein